MAQNKDADDQILVIGAGMAGIEASLSLAAAGKKVYLVEREPLFGGQVIKYEEVFANMECSTCMAAPKQQEVLQNERIELLTLSEVKEVQGEAGDFTVKITKKARYVDSEACIGCNACFDPCPVSLPNAFEEGLGERKAIYISCPGALPNVPTIDSENCVRFTGEDCNLCQEACMFEAIDFDQKDEGIEVRVSAIIVATGYHLLDVMQASGVEYSETGNVYTALEMERLYASNGQTGGKIVLRSGKEPSSAAIVHCIGRKEVGYCSGVCCMYSLKFVHYLTDKLPEIKLYEFVSDLCIPGKSYQAFYEKLKDKVQVTRFQNLSISQRDSTATISFQRPSGEDDTLKVDMVILAPAVVPAEGAMELAEVLGIRSGKTGFYETESESLSGVVSSREGIYLAGCAQGPKDIAKSITQADAAVGRLLASMD
jgi:heterodisulfide reductase subunit A